MSLAPHRPTRTRLDVLLLLAGLLSIVPACHPQRRLVQTHREPPSPILAGSGSVTQDGQFRFRLADPLACKQVVIETWCAREDLNAQELGLKDTCAEKDTEQRTESLPSCTVPMKRLTATPPWGEPVSADVRDDGIAVFTIDWAKSRIDPLADDAPHAARRAWSITGEGAKNRLSWVPTDADIGPMLAAIGKAKGMVDMPVDLTVDPNAKPALLAIKSIEAQGKTLVAGQVNRIRLTVQNRSPGPAYRVVARTRSSHPALHDLKFVFGRIDGSKEMTRELTVKLPATRDDDSPMVVVTASGANVAEVDHNQRVSIRRAPKVPPASMALRCKLADQVAPGPPVVEAGERAAIWCEVQNTGELAVRRVKLTAKGPARSVGAALKKTLAPGRRARVQMRVPIPAGARVGAKLTIQVSAVANKARAKTNIMAKVVRDRACPDGLLTRPQYARKRAKLKKLLAQGVLAQEEFDKYEAELLRCLE